MFTFDPNASGGSDISAEETAKISQTIIDTFVETYKEHCAALQPDRSAQETEAECRQTIAEVIRRERFAPGAASRISVQHLINRINQYLELDNNAELEETLHARLDGLIMQLHPTITMV
jgi:hypothetical protein